MRVWLLPSAREDLANGRGFYERQGENLGAYFFDSLFSDIDSLALFGGIHRKVFGYHRLLSRRFPFAIYYRVEGDVVVVRRVLDCRQNPARLRQTLGTS